MNIIFELSKTILAARNDYFRAMLFGGLAETDKSLIEVGETTPEAFQQVVQVGYSKLVYKFIINTWN